MRVDGGQFMKIDRDIHPLTDFKRNTSHFLSQLKETGQPLVLTINGKAELVVQDAASYQKLASRWSSWAKAIRAFSSREWNR